ncbi:zf-HC2 domain-containing protein, partial [bacterium]|nr:zf-HC2 domain-containing protein [bacterium]
MNDKHECEACLKFLEVLSDYHDGVLDEAVATKLEVHMLECERCRAVVKTFKQTIVYYRSSRCVEV